MRGIKVRLNADLTEYLPGLVKGTEGLMREAQGIWSKTSDRFVSVDFQKKGTLDVLWDSLEIIDEEYLKEKEKRDQKYLKELKTAWEVVKYIGPRGGFKYLSYKYFDSDGIRINVTQAYKEKAEELIGFFENNDIKIIEKILK